MQNILDQRQNNEQTTTTAPNIGTFDKSATMNTMMSQDTLSSNKEVQGQKFKHLGTHVSPERSKFIVKIDEIPEDEEISESVFTADLASSSRFESSVDDADDDDEKAM